MPASWALASRRCLNAQIERAPYGKWTRIDQVPQPDPFDQLHREEGGGVRVADLKNRDDVGVIERRSGARFLGETEQSFAVGQKAGRQNLQGHLPPEARIASPVDLSHSP